MATKTVFNQSAVAPPPFNLGNIPVHNIAPVPVFLQKGYIGGSTPEALPATGLQPQTAKGILSGILPRKIKK